MISDISMEKKQEEVMSVNYRILTPSEYEALRDAATSHRFRMILDTLLNTGMRYSEFERFAEDLTTFDSKNRAITLPQGYTKTGKERVIHLTPAFATSLSQYLREFKELDIPQRQTMDANLRRWWNNGYLPDNVIGPIRWNPTVKTFRKTWESWLLAAGYQSMPVALSQGHSELISFGHYANLDPRLKSEMDKVRKYTEGWGT